MGEQDFYHPVGASFQSPAVFPICAGWQRVHQQLQPEHQRRRNNRGTQKRHPRPHRQSPPQLETEQPASAGWRPGTEMEQHLAEDGHQLSVPAERAARREGLIAHCGGFPAGGLGDRRLLDPAARLTGKPVPHTLCASLSSAGCRLHQSGAAPVPASPPARGRKRVSELWPLSPVSDFDVHGNKHSHGCVDSFGWKP